MNSAIKRIALLAAIVALLDVTVACTTAAYSPRFNSEDRVVEFLSSVVGLDMTKYTLTQPSLPPDYVEDTKPNATSNYPAMFGGLVEVEAPIYTFEANGSKLTTMATFYDGQMAFFNAYLRDGQYFYSGPKPTMLNQAKSILQRYQTYVTQTYATDGSYVANMQNALEGINDLLPTNTTVGNVNFQISNDGVITRLQWIYTENGISMDWKRIELSFHNGTFDSFADTWRLYAVSGPSAISSKEAVKIALESAQQVELRMVNEKGETEIVEPPNLSNATYDVYFTMMPYRYQEGYSPSKISRDPLTLYPCWQVYFYFNEKIAGDDGIQVGVWGDTSEIIYASGFGSFGVPSTQTEKDAAMMPLSALDLSVLIAMGVAAVLIISAAIVALRKRKGYKQ